MQKKKTNKKLITFVVIIIALLLLLIFSKNIKNPQNKNKLNLSENTAQEATIVEPNIPVLSAGMIPVKWDGSNWIITEQTDNDWYNYSQGKLAYIMLNDGYYKSELESGIEENQLSIVGVGVPDDPQTRGSIYIWIPRFAVNKQGDIQYIKDVQNAEDGFEIPEMFAYRQASETIPDFLLTGAWVAIDTDTKINSTIAEMNNENGKYGFIKNTIATQITTTDIDAVQKYVGVGVPDDPQNTINDTVGNDAIVVPQITDITNPNRIVLKIINQNNQDPIKAKGTYNKDTGLIEIQVTYSQYGIARVLYEDNQELKLTSNNNKATATSEGLNIKYGTALIKIVDNKGNTKELKIGVTSKVYVTLYTDGTLGFCSNTSKIEGKTVSKDYGDISDKTFVNATQVSWYGQTNSITTVQFVDEIAPISTARWFNSCYNLERTNNIEKLNTINVTNMSYMFSNCSGLSLLDLSKFNTSKVMNMEGMFNGCNGLTSLDVSNFDTSNVAYMYDMFNKCSSLTELNLNSFNTRNVTDMNAMFSGCNSLTLLDLSSFDTGNIIGTYSIFYNCTSLSQITFGEKWDKEVTLPTFTKQCAGWYSDAEFTNKVANAGANYTPVGPITIYANVPPDIFVTLYTDGTLTFASNNNKMEEKTVSKDYGDISEKQINSVSSIPWYQQTSNIKIVEFVDEISPILTAWWFRGCSNLTEIKNIQNLNTKNVTNMTQMFYKCSSLTQLDLSSFNTSNVTKMENMFEYCNSLTSLNVGNFNTSNVTNMESMFGNCTGLTSLDVRNFDTRNVTDMRYMFERCRSLKTLDLSNFDTKNIGETTGMFSDCSNLTSLDLSSFDTSNVTWMYSMFDGCSSLTSLDISNFDTRNVQMMERMFYGCNNLEIIYVGENWVKAPRVTNMFTNCGTSSVTKK